MEPVRGRRQTVSRRRRRPYLSHRQPYLPYRRGSRSRSRRRLTMTRVRQYASLVRWLMQASRTESRKPRRRLTRMQ